MDAGFCLRFRSTVLCGQSIGKGLILVLLRAWAPGELASAFFAGDALLAASSNRNRCGWAGAGKFRLGGGKREQLQSAPGMEDDCKGRWIHKKLMDVAST